MSNKYKEFSYSKSQSPLEKILIIYKEGGIRKLISKLYHYYERNILFQIQFIKHKNIQKYLVLGGREFKHFHHPYNHTWTNERAIEVSVIKGIIDDHSEKSILEVGNVLSNYFSVHWDILDKFDSSGKSLNEDVVSYIPPKAKYDLVVSISTFEHIGLDDEEKDPKRVLTAIENVRNNYLNSTGKFIITFPIGYNKILDSFFFNDSIKFEKYYCLKKISKRNEWIEVGKLELTNVNYNFPYKYGNGLVIGFINK